MAQAGMMYDAHFRTGGLAMVAALLGVVLVFGGLYWLTRNAPIWQQAQSTVAHLAAALPTSAWHRVEYVAAIGAVVIGAAIILLRLFGGLRRA